MTEAHFKIDRLVQSERFPLEKNYLGYRSWDG